MVYGRFRFLLPMLPLCHLFGGRGIASLHSSWCPRHTSTTADAQGGGPRGRPRLFGVLVGGALALQGAAAVYFCLVHQVCVLITSWCVHATLCWMLQGRLATGD